MALQFPSDLPPEQRQKPPFDYETMFCGLLMGLAVLAFAACLLLVINGKAEQWLRERFGVLQLKKGSFKQSQSSEGAGNPR
ncbi:MAG: hypothetical protein K1X78_09425 [Verrucomicrobiaceae bacterium]|nr:hypothetical protein [Verrucomicrobiaceae bacterium]